MKNIFLSFFFVAMVSIGFSHDKKSIEVLFQKFNQSGIDSSRVLILNEMALAFCDTNLAISKQYARQALNLANKIKYRPGIALSNKNFGFIFLKSKSYQPAINYYLICIKIYKELGEFSEIADAYNQIGKINKEQGHQGQALDNFNSALIIADSIFDDYNKAYAYNQIGGIHFEQSYFDLAFDYFLKSQMLFEGIRDSVGMASTYNNVGEIYRLRGQFTEALELYSKSLKINKVLGNFLWEAINLKNIGDVYLAQQDFAKAFSSYNTSLQINKKINDIDGMANANISLGNYNLQVGKPEQALSLFTEAMTIGHKHKNARSLSAATLGISEAYKKLNKLGLALNFFKIHSAIKDSMFNVEKARQIAEMESKSEADRQKQQLVVKDKEIEIYKRNSRIFRLQMILTIGGLLVAIIIAILFVRHQKARNYKDRELIQKNTQIHQAQQQLMQSELQIKNNELMNFALHIVQKNDFLQAVKNDLKEIKSKCGDNNQIQKISETLLKVNQNLRMSTELEQFQKNVDNVNHEFFKKLESKFPNLTENEKRLSALLRLNLSSKEIATLNNISIKAVEMGRYRLRKKINLETNEGLAEFLQKL
jgi:tetratricopeptide (TPR) repeat protein